MFTQSYYSEDESLEPRSNIKRRDFPSVNWQIEDQNTWKDSLRKLVDLCLEFGKQLVRTSMIHPLVTPDEKRGTTYHLSYEPFVG